VPPFAETQDYVRKVISLYYQYKGQLAAPTTTGAGSPAGPPAPPRPPDAPGIP